MSYFPMMINLENKHVLVTGGGEEGQKKVEVLRSFHAVITLIAVNATERAVELSDTYIPGEFKDSYMDSEDFELVVAAADDRRVNEHISRLAGEKKIPVNVVDDTELCTFIFPAIIKDGDVVCSVSSGGKSPYIAQHVKRLITEVLPPKIGEINDRMGRFREKAKKEIDDPEERRRFLRRKLDELLEE